MKELGELKYFLGLTENQVRIFYDNLSSIRLTENPIFHATIKHIEIHYHYISTTKKRLRVTFFSGLSSTVLCTPASYRPPPRPPVICASHFFVPQSDLARQHARRLKFENVRVRDLASQITRAASPWAPRLGPPRRRRRRSPRRGRSPRLAVSGLASASPSISYLMTLFVLILYLDRH